MDDELRQIAARIRDWRDEASLTLQQLGDRACVSASTIHKIENLQTVPTIAVLLKIAHGLNRRPSELLAEVGAGRQVAVMRREDRQTLAVDECGAIQHLIGTIPRNKLDICRVRIEPGVGAGMEGHEPWQFRGEMVLLIEEGRVRAEIGGEIFELESGDSIHFDPSIPHRWIATGERAAQALTIAIAPENMQGDLMNRITNPVGTRSIANRCVDMPAEDALALRRSSESRDGALGV